MPDIVLWPLFAALGSGSGVVGRGRFSRGCRFSGCRGCAIVLRVAAIAPAAPPAALAALTPHFLACLA